MLASETNFLFFFFLRDLCWIKLQKNGWQSIVSCWHALFCCCCFFFHWDAGFRWHWVLQERKEHRYYATCHCVVVFNNTFVTSQYRTRVIHEFISGPTQCCLLQLRATMFFRWQIVSKWIGFDTHLATFPSWWKDFINWTNWSMFALILMMHIIPLCMGECIS